MRRLLRDTDKARLLPENRAALRYGLIVVTALGAGVAGTILACRNHLPDPVATHFGNSAPDGFESVTATAIIAFVFTLALGGMLVTMGAMFPGPRWVRRMIFGFGVAMAFFIAMLFLATTLAQMGLDHATDARMNWATFFGPLFTAPLVGWALSPLIRE